jgi:hypothetical protein
MSYNARLFNEGRLKGIVELTDGISDNCQIVADALADYEGASELTGSERTEMRESSRESAFQALGDLLSDARRLKDEYDKILDLPS